MKSGIFRSPGRFALLSSSDDCSVKYSLSIVALSVLSEYMSPFTLSGGMDEVLLGLLKVFSVFHQSLEQFVLSLLFSVSLSIYSFFDLRIS